MTTEEAIQMQRSISMPVKPKHLEPQPLRRADKKEVVYDEDFYPESPSFVRNKNTSEKHGNSENNDDSIGVMSNLPFNFDWVGSTIELNNDEINKDTQESPPTVRKRVNRVIGKNGRENVSYRKVPHKSWRYIRDFVTTLIELDWKYMLTMFLGSYFFTWFFFAGLCYMVAISHGDLLFDVETGQRLGEGKAPCIVGVYDFTSMLIYSIETQTTIGFGEKYPSEECPETIFLFIVQIICSIAIEGGMISIIYAKTARPAKQITKLKFSDKAVICYRDLNLCLIFRVCDLRQQQIIDTKIRLYMIVDRPTREGELIKTHTELQLEGNGHQIIVWPETVCHIIDKTSPLYRYKTAKDFNAAQFELYVSIVGTSPTTAQVTEARTSYLPREIFWGQSFINLINYDVVNERYVIDYSNFNTTISVDMAKPLEDETNAVAKKLN